MKLKTLIESVLFFVIACCVSVSCSSDDDNEKPQPTPQPEPTEELTFELNVSDIKAHGAELTAVPSVKDKKYIADVAPAALFANKSDDEIVSMIIDAVNEDALVMGDITFKADGMDLEPETDYVFFALGYEAGRPVGKLALKTFTTAEEEVPLPQLFINGTAGDKDGNNKYSQIFFNVKSDIATKMVYLLADNSSEGQNLEDEGYIEKIINDRGQIATEEEVQTLNSTAGLCLTYRDLSPEHIYTLIVRVSNKTGAVTQKLSVTTESKPFTPKNPEILLNGHTGDENGYNRDSQIMFSLSCVSKDASYAEMFVTEKDKIDALLTSGISLEEIVMANKGNGLIMTSEELDQVNTKAYTLSLDNTDGVIPDTEYTCLALVENQYNYVSVACCNLKTEPFVDDGKAPTVEVNGRAGDVNGANKSEAVTFTVSCTSKNASYAEAFVAETTFVNEILQGMTLEELMTYNAGIGKILQQEDIKLLNEGGIDLSWNQLLCDTEYSLLFCVKTKSGAMTVKRCDVKTAPDINKVQNMTRRPVKGQLTISNVRCDCPRKLIRTLKAPAGKHNGKYNGRANTKVGKLPGLFMNR